MLLYEYPRILTFVWAVGACSFLAKASRSRADVIPLHLACFLSMGWSICSIYSDVVERIPPQMWSRMVFGGTLYTVGIIPWAIGSLEFHNVIWHAFVLAASATFFQIIYEEVALPAGG